MCGLCPEPYSTKLQVLANTRVLSKRSGKRQTRVGSVQQCKLAMLTFYELKHAWLPSMGESTSQSAKEVLSPRKAISRNYASVCNPATRRQVPDRTERQWCQRSPNLARSRLYHKSIARSPGSQCLSGSSVINLFQPTSEC